MMIVEMHTTTRSLTEMCDIWKRCGGHSRNRCLVQSRDSPLTQQRLPQCRFKRFLHAHQPTRRSRGGGNEKERPNE